MGNNLREREKKRKKIINMWCGSNDPQTEILQEFSGAY